MVFKKVCAGLLSALLTVSVMSVCAVDANALTPTYTCSASYKTSKYYKQLCNVKLTGNCADDIVNIARSQVGYHEGTSNKELAGAGTKVEGVEGGNFTEYGYFFNNGKSGYGSWCAYFVNWCARQAGISPNIIYAKDGYVESILNYYKKGINGTWYKGPHYGGTYVPKKGDIAIIDFVGDYNGGDHIGIVSKDAKDLTYFDIIGGNEGDTVCDGYFADFMEGQRHTDSIVGFFHPDYYKNSYVDDPTNPENYASSSRTLKVNSRGDDVKFLQAVLYQLKYLKKTSDIDGVFGKGTEEALKRYQKDRGLKDDGIYGAGTRAKIEADWDIIYDKLFNSQISGNKTGLVGQIEDATFDHAVVGDVNGDDEISLVDVTELQKYIAKLINSDSFGTMSQLDVNCDDSITVEDVVTLQRHIAGLINIY